LNDCENKKILLEQMDESFKEKYNKLADIKMDTNSFESIQDVANYFSFSDNGGGMSPEARRLLKDRPELFKEFVDFLFWTAKKRKYSFSQNLRSSFASVATNSGIYIEKAVIHYFKLYAKNGSYESRNRITSWLEKPMIKKNKNLILILAGSRHRGVQFEAINRADQKLYPYMVADIKDPVAKAYLDRKMEEPEFEAPVYQFQRELEKETGASYKFTYR